MSFDIPDLRYLDTHEWVRIEDGRARVGISDFAQDELGDGWLLEVDPADESELDELLSAGEYEDRTA